MAVFWATLAEAAVASTEMPETVNGSSAACAPARENTHARPSMRTKAMRCMGDLWAEATIPGGFRPRKRQGDAKAAILPNVTVLRLGSRTLKRVPQPARGAPQG